MLPPMTSAASSFVIPAVSSAVASTRQDAIGGYVLRESAREIDLAARYGGEELTDRKSVV